jgi:hypothetical protein
MARVPERPNASPPRAIEGATGWFFIMVELPDNTTIPRVIGAPEEQ